jgi:hypothetical protein
MRKVTIALMLVSGLACGAGGNGRSADVASPGETGEAQQLEVPEEGPYNQRVKTLWELTRPIVQADAQAGHSDAEYLARRQPIWNAWIGLQMSAAGEGSEAEQQPRSEAIIKVLDLLNQVYGWPAFSVAEREEERRKTGRIQNLVEEIDVAVAGL